MNEVQSRHPHPQHDGETLEHRHQVHDSTARSAGTGQSEARGRLDQFHVPLHLRRLLLPVQARRRRRYPGRHRLRVRHQPNLCRHRAHAHGDPDLHDPALHDAARPCQPRREPRRGIAVHPRLDVQRGRGVLDLLLWPLHRTRAAAPGLHPAFRLDLAPHAGTVDARARRTASLADPAGTVDTWPRSEQPAWPRTSATCGPSTRSTSTYPKAAWPGSSARTVPASPPRSMWIEPASVLGPVAGVFTLIIFHFFLGRKVYSLSKGSYVGSLEDRGRG